MQENATKRNDHISETSKRMKESEIQDIELVQTLRKSSFILEKLCLITKLEKWL